MTKFVVPKVIISKCIEFDRCRYNGDIIHSEFVSSLKPFVEFIPVCAECEIGLGIPRDPIRIVLLNKKTRLIQPSTNTDCTDKMVKFSADFLNSLDKPCGAILKAYSPSCGIKGVKIYPAFEKVASVDTGAGFFGAAVVEKFSNLAVEDELRLSNFRIREHFLTKLFVIASFYKIASKPSMKALIEFQSDNKLLLMTYNQAKMRELGKTVANHLKKPAAEVFADYETLLYKAFAKLPSYAANVNTLMHAFGYFSDKLTSKEKAFFLDALEKYRLEKAPLCIPVSLVKSMIVRFGEEYLSRQTYFAPYPEELYLMSDTGKGRIK